MYASICVRYAYFRLSFAHLSSAPVNLILLFMLLLLFTLRTKICMLYSIGHRLHIAMGDPPTVTIGDRLPPLAIANKYRYKYYLYRLLKQSIINHQKKRA